MPQDSLFQPNFSPRVGIARLPTVSYDSSCPGENAIEQALARLADSLDWCDETGLFGRVIPPGARVLIKPNLVLHQNEGPGGMECLVTHASVIRAVAEAALRTRASEVLIGDAPIQGCNFDALVDKTGLAAWAEEHMNRDRRFRGLRDFRRTTCVLVHGVRVAEENLQSEDRFTLFDLGSKSLLEPISGSHNPFRVAWYDHRLMARTHHAGVHQYLLAKEVLDADVVINLPKLKTHKKAGVTCALKNLIGINGNKEFLPHHRIGGPKTGGDNYPDDSALKRAMEFISDRQNVTNSYAGAMVWRIAFGILARASRYRGDRIGMDGSWSGNDTIWRTCLDLNRILLYGGRDGRMRNDLQRRVIHVADAVVAGQGNGPLAPDPLELGLLLGADNAAAMDWVGAQLLAYSPEKISLVRHAFDRFEWPISDVPSSKVRLVGDLGAGAPNEILGRVRTPVSHPVGWVNAAADPVPAEPRIRQGNDLAAASVEPQDA
ncbi:MAG: DUF362 domain-containing protein [Acidobacteriaceae bacterium]|nr:DUF362 domain-containing protein [Acidobacteriaceae bacterium]